MFKSESLPWLAGAIQIYNSKCLHLGVLSSPWPQTLSPKLYSPKTKTKGPWLGRHSIAVGHPPTTTRKLLSMKEGSHNKTQIVRTSQNGPLYLSSKKIQVDSERKDMGQSTMFKENIIKLTLCIIIKCQHPGQTNSVHDGPNVGFPCSQRKDGTVPHYSLVNL